MDDEIGELADEKEYWKHLAKKLGYTGDAPEQGFKLPKILITLAPYGLLFIIGYSVAPYLTRDYHPALIGAALTGIGFVGKWLLDKIRA
jgi:hypothetical protein